MTNNTNDSKRVTFSDGTALIPLTKEGKKWEREAAEIQSLPDTEETCQLWDDHSMKLTKIGGRWE